MDDIAWKKLLSEVKPVSISIEGLLRSAKPLGLEGNNLKLGVYYKFHKDKLEEARNRKILEEAALKVFEKNIRIQCLLTEAPSNIQLTENTNENIMTAAEEIFS